jgi:hypothetical protein
MLISRLQAAMLVAREDDRLRLGLIDGYLTDTLKSSPWRVIVFAADQVGR